jgi:hypothetical protein
MFESGQIGALRQFGNKVSDTFSDGGGEMTRKIMRLYTDFTRDYVTAN